MNIDSIILEARGALPEAFTIEADDAHRTVDPIEIEGAERMRALDVSSELDGEPFEFPAPPDDALLQAAFDVERHYDPTLRPLPGSFEVFSDADHEDASETEAIHRERGFEIFASYVSFRTVHPEGKWGIFYRREGIRRLALLLMRDVKADSTEARRLAYSLLWAHERFHFRFDLGALYDELVLKAPLYNRYSQEVYKKVIFTSECFEESLANRAVSLLSIRGSQVSNSDLTQFVKEFCKNSPPGYCDYDRAPVVMKEYFIGSCTFSAGKFIKCKLGGYIWIVHPFDVDPWPSKPHAHNYDQRQKLNLSSGEIFSLPARKPVGKLRSEELLSIRKEISLRLPNLALPPMAA